MRGQQKEGLFNGQALANTAMEQEPPQADAYDPRATVTFDCPGCGNLCAFAARHAGRQAHCLRCGTHFIVPDRDGARVRRIEDPSQAKEPMPGFFYSLVRRTPGALATRSSLTMLVFLSALVCFRFFLANADFSAALPGFALVLPIGWVAIAVTWGLQLWGYMEIIGTTFLDVDEMSSEELGGTWGFLAAVFKNLYLFVSAMLSAMLPFILLAALLRSLQVPPKITYPIPWLGLTLLPMILLILGTGADWYWVFNVWAHAKIIRRALGAYLTVLLLLLAAGLLQVFTRQYGQLTDKTAAIRWLHLAGNLAAMLVSVIAMRAIGLFGRHCADLLPWLE